MIQYGIGIDLRVAVEVTQKLLTASAQNLNSFR